MTWGRGSTRQSRREREQVLTGWPTCYLRYPGCTGTSTEDDHVIPKWRGGSDDLTNRRGACHHCHGIKSRREAAEAKQSRHQRRTEPHPGRTNPSTPPPTPSGHRDV